MPSSTQEKKDKTDAEHADTNATEDEDDQNVSPAGIPDTAAWPSPGKYKIINFPDVKNLEALAQQSSGDSGHRGLA